MAGDFVMRNHGAIERAIHVENASDCSKTSQNAVLLGKDRSRRALAGINAGVAGRIARGPVLEQRVLNNGGDATAVKVHNADVGSKSCTKLFGTNVYRHKLLIM